MPMHRVSDDASPRGLAQGYTKNEAQHKFRAYLWGQIEPFGPHSTRSGHFPLLTDVVKLGPALAEFGRSLTDVWQHLAKLGRSQAQGHLANTLSKLANTSPGSG